jgi:acyl carrier protein
MKKIDFKFIEGVYKKALNLQKYKLTINSKFEEVPGWDSFGHLRLITEIEKKLKISFEIEEFVGVDTVKKIMKLVQSKIK